MNIYLWTLSGILAAMGIVTLVRRAWLFSSGIRTRGKFVRWEVQTFRKQGHERQVFSPVISFQAVDGKEYEVLGPGGATQIQATSYPLLYFQKKPEKAMVYSVQGFWAAPPAFLLLAVASAYVAYDM